MGRKRRRVNLSCLATLIFILVLSLVLAILRNEKLSDLFWGLDRRQDALLRKYDAMLGRAQVLSQRYRNMTRGATLPVPISAALATSKVSSDRNSNYKDGTLKLQFQPSMPANLPDSLTESATAPVLKDLVLGMAQDTDPKNFVVFASSLRKVSTADIIIFVNTPTPQRHDEIATAKNIKLVPFALSSLAPVMQSFHPSTLRWPLFFRYLQSEETRKQYGRIWMIDVRDSYFQADPFSMLPSGQRGFHVFNGVETVSIRDCGWNSGWVKDCFGESTLSEVGNANIICSGVSMGDTATVLEYLTLMDDIILSRGKSAISKIAKFPRCERNGVDQGIHNVLVHKKLVSFLKIFSQSDGPVANLQAQRARVRDGEVFNQNGDLVPVVHQYDRRPDLQKALFGKYVYWIDTNDAAAEWKAEPACNLYAAKSDVDMFKGMCDIKNQGGATSAASCCAFCEKNPSCRAFTFYSSVCFLKSCSESTRQASLPGAVSAFKSITT